MLKTILYNSDEGIKDEVNERLRKTVTTIITSTTNLPLEIMPILFSPIMMPNLTEIYL
jgi:hypothetical protein